MMRCLALHRRITIASCVVLLVGVAMGPVSMAQPAPQTMARAALGSDPGWASVASWRSGALAKATMRRLPGATLAEPVTDTPPAPLYEVGSISKLFTGLLLAQAVERGDLSLDDTVGKMLQGKITLASPRVAGITLRQLITHSACLPRQFGKPRSAQAVESQLRTANRLDLMLGLAQQQIDNSPPCPARYSNFGIAVVGELLSEHYGKPWHVLVDEQVVQPLGMVDTAVHAEGKADRLVAAYSGDAPAEPWPMVAYAGAGGLRSTAPDLVTFGRALLAGRGGPLGAAAERMLVPLGTYEGREIGYAVFIHGPPQRRTYSHDGLTGGFRALLVMAPDSGEVMAALVSNRQAPLAQMAQAWWAQRYPVESQPIAIDPAALAELTGIYETGSDLRLLVVVHAQTLLVRAPGSVFRAYLPVARDRFTRPAGGARVSFERDAAGTVRGLILEQSGNRFVAQKAALAPPQPEILPAGRALDFVGRYVATAQGGAAVVFDVRAEDGQLLVRSSRFPWEPVLPLADQVDRFRYDVADTQLQFERDASGKVVALVLYQRGALRAERVMQGS